MASVPVIDISGLSSDHASQRQQVVDQLMKAATEIGFLQARFASILLYLTTSSEGTRTRSQSHQFEDSHRRQGKGFVSTIAFSSSVVISCLEGRRSVESKFVIMMKAHNKS